MLDALMRCEDVVVRRGRFSLGPIDLAIGKGITTLVGRNGSGKTTLLRTLVGLERVRSGRVEVLGAAAGRSRTVASAVGYVPQGAVIPDGALVADIVGYAAWLKGLTARSSRTSVATALTQLEVDHLARRRVRTLSGGERQRVSIAMALVHDPSVLILDEPSVGLDPVQRVTLRRTLDVLSRSRAIFLSTHLVEDIGSADDRVLALSSGRIVFAGAADELRQLPGGYDGASSELERGLWHVLGGEE